MMEGGKGRRGGEGVRGGVVEGQSEEGNKDSVRSRHPKRVFFMINALEHSTRFR